MKHYTDLRLSDTAKAVQTLPDINPATPQTQPKVMRATGTYDAATHSSALTDHRAQGNQQQSCGSKQNSMTRIGNDVSDSQRASAKKTTRVSTPKYRPNFAIQHDAARTDLMPGDDVANMLETRAVGAVG